jgi:chemotaxis protein methyltransferase CheR
VSATGLAYYLSRDTILTEIIARRLTQLNLSSCFEYLAMLQGGDGGRELRAISDEMAVGETYFFRNQDHFTALRSVILPQLLRRKARERRLTIWSAGCACGAEPYSLAIFLKHEFGQQLRAWDVRITGTDLSQALINQAQHGQFSDWAFRAMPEELIDKCFRNEGRFRTIAPEYRDWVSFEYHNLVDGLYPPPCSGVQSFDIVLCRNVLIYFSPEGAAEVVEQFHGCLAEGGWLIVGASETSSQAFGAFETVPFDGPTLYQKPRKREPQPVAPKSGRVRPVDSQPLSLANRIDKPVNPPEDLDEPRLLADRGDWAAAARCCEQMLEQNSQNPRVYFYYALVTDHLGDTKRAKEFLRKALYLDREFVLAHYHIGLALKRENDARQAARHFRVVLELLERVPERLREDQDITAVELKALAKLQLEGLAEA